MKKKQINGDIINIGNYTFMEVERFKYLGTILPNKEEMKLK